MNVLASQWGHLFTNTEDFIGRPRVSDDGRTIVYVSQENRQHFLGHLTLLGLKEAIMPWCSDGPGEAEAGGSLEIALSHWADATHAQGGHVVIPHLPSPNGEPATLIATGRVDAVEMLRQQPFPHMEYYRYLNGGYRLPLAGGTDKMSADVPVGLYRTYVRLPEGESFDYDAWCRNMAAGRTYSAAARCWNSRWTASTSATPCAFPKAAAPSPSAPAPSPSAHPQPADRAGRRSRCRNPRSGRCPASGPDR